MSVALLGGIFLIIGSYFVYKGDIFKSVFVYFLADIIWIILGFQSGDILGSIFIIIGAVLGFLAFLKMNSGIFNKKISK